VVGVGVEGFIEGVGVEFCLDAECNLATRALRGLSLKGLDRN
jgi:hypothetical protein